MNRHVTILGTLHLVYGGLTLLVALVVLVATVGAGELSEALADIPGVEGLTTGVGVTVAAIIALLSLPSLLGGIGLLQRKSWARALALVGAALALFSFPVGTALGIYTLWAMTRQDLRAVLN